MDADGIQSEALKVACKPLRLIFLETIHQGNKGLQVAMLAARQDSKKPIAQGKRRRPPRSPNLEPVIHKSAAHDREPGQAGSSTKYQNIRFD